MAPTFENNNYVVAEETFSGKDGVFPVVDYSKLVSTDPVQRAEAVRELGIACSDYGYFSVANHGVPEELIKGITNGFFSFFDLSEKEKKVYDTNDAADAIRLGIVDTNELSRQFITCSSHPTFHCPSDIPNLSELMQEYSKQAREVTVELLRGISETLGLHKTFIDEAMRMEQGYDRYSANDYPSRMKSEKPIGQFAHTDPALLILLVQNVSGGLQMEHHGSWVNANLPPNSLIANIADQLEILTNGKYKSKVHRVVVNNEVRRFTLPLFVGPALDVVVKPAPEFVDESHPPSFHGMTYREYLEANDFHLIDGKSCLNEIRI